MERIDNKSYIAARNLPVEVECAAVGAFISTLPSTVPTSWSWFNFNTILMIIGTTALITTISLITSSPQAAAYPVQQSEVVTFEIKAPLTQPVVAEQTVVFDLVKEIAIEKPAQFELSGENSRRQKSELTSFVAAVNHDVMPEFLIELPFVGSQEIKPDSIFLEINNIMTDDEIRRQLVFAREHGVCLCSCNWHRSFGKVKRIDMSMKANEQCFQSLEIKRFKSVVFDWKLIGDDVVEFHKCVNGGKRSRVTVGSDSHTHGIQKFD